MDIFGDDIDSFYNNNELNENINEENIEEADEDNANANKDDDGDDVKIDENGEPIKVEPKKRSVRRPQVSLSIILSKFSHFLTQKNEILFFYCSCV